jgi:hypothetical protein
MAHIKEPKGVDFIIQSEPLTDEARQKISAFINAYKAKKPKAAAKAKRVKTVQSKNVKV